MDKSDPLTHHGGGGGGGGRRTLCIMHSYTTAMGCLPKVVYLRIAGLIREGWVGWVGGGGGVCVWGRGGYSRE